MFLGGFSARLVEHLFVKRGAGDYVFLGSPIAQIEKTAALAAKREVSVASGIGRFLADRAVVFHQRNLLADRPQRLYSL
jgi:hypothetical protein